MAFDHSGRTAGSFLVVSSPLLSEGYRSRIYRRLRLRWIAAILVGACVATAAAAPVVLVTDGGLSGGGNQLWNLAIGPDVPSFAAETSLAVEIGIEFSSPILSAALDDAFWNVGVVENSGNNPFTGGVTSGLWLDASAGQLFVSAGSELYETPAPRALLVVETPGTGAMRIVIGGQEVTPAGGGEPYLGARIAQNGINFDGISTIIDPLMNFLPGDFNGNGSVENADLTLLLNNWGAGAAPVPPGWTGDPPTGTAIDNSELTALLNNWGAIGTPSGGARLAVPEGTSLAIVALAVAFVVAAVRHRYFRARGGAG